jgi:Calcineurin-like phosphoesterase
MSSQPGAAPAGQQPGRILVAGDWHGDLDWARSVIWRLPQLLAGEPTRLILHLGDFGIWPGAGGERYLSGLAAVLAGAGASIGFVDGNHEDFDQLDAMTAAAGPGVPVAIRPNIMYLPRGYRWRWHGQSWLACGGGVSLDRSARTQGADWWPQEEITAGQAAVIAAGGHADVMVCHDCPDGVPHDFGRPPAWWDPADLRRSQMHRQRLRQIVDTVRPSYLMHGHLHVPYQDRFDFGYGPLQITGLAAEGTLENFAVLDLETMTWPGAGRRLRPLRTGR